MRTENFSDQLFSLLIPINKGVTMRILFLLYPIVIFYANYSALKKHCNNKGPIKANKYIFILYLLQANFVSGAENISEPC